jgi:uncharacterized damage-inducible protein DinB
MATAVALLDEAFGRLPELGEAAVTGLPQDRLNQRLSGTGNSIAWLVWHLTRIQDHHVAELLQGAQLWVDGGWAERFGLDPDPQNHGYGHSPEEVAAVRPDGPGILVEYLDAVWERTRSLLEGLTAADLDRVVDRRWDPQVTLGVRLVSIADDSLQHVGQAAYVRGLLGG